MSSWSVAIATEPAPISRFRARDRRRPRCRCLRDRRDRRIADEVIGKAGQRDLVVCRVHQPAREILARRDQERGVIEARGVARLARRTLAPLQFDSATPPERSSTPITVRAITSGQSRRDNNRRPDRGLAPASSPCRPASASGWRRLARRPTCPPHGPLQRLPPVSEEAPAR